MAMIKTSWEKVKEDKEKDDYDSITPSGFKHGMILKIKLSRSIFYYKLNKNKENIL